MRATTRPIPPHAAPARGAPGRARAARARACPPRPGTAMSRRPRRLRGRRRRRSSRGRCPRSGREAARAAAQARCPAPVRAPERPTGQAASDYPGAAPRLPATAAVSAEGPRRRRATSGATHARPRTRVRAKPPTRRALQRDPAPRTQTDACAPAASPACPHDALALGQAGPSPSPHTQSFESRDQMACRAITSAFCRDERTPRLRRLFDCSCA